ncbi:2269_t:CDS:1, partial [Funneliformis caledonium]
KESVKEYCEMFFLYVVTSMSSGKSAENIKEKFIRSLLPAYETKVTSCDLGLPFDSLIDRLIIYKKNRLAGPEQ